MGGAEPNENAGKAWLSNQQKPWLLIIDNADDPDIDATRYFPGGERGTILLTTRNPSHKRYGTAGSRFYHFEKLNADEASDLLLRAADLPLPWEAADRNRAAIIAEALAFLPLALIHAGKAILDGLCQLGNYLDYHIRFWDRVRSTRGIGDVNLHVYSTWEIIYLGLENKKGQAAQDGVQLLNILSFFYWENIRFDILVSAALNRRREAGNSMKATTRTARNAIPRYTIRSWKEYMTYIAFRYVQYTQTMHPLLPPVLRDDDASFDEDRLREALGFLVQLGMLNYHRKTDSYWMHPLVHTYVRERPENKTAMQAMWCQVAKAILMACIFFNPPREYKLSDQIMRRHIYPHVEFSRHCYEQVSRRIEINRQRSRGKFLSFWFTTPSHFGPSQAEELAKFSLVYLHCGNWNEAERLQLKVKSFVCDMLGLQHEKTIDGMSFPSHIFLHSIELSLLDLIDNG